MSYAAISSLGASSQPFPCWDAPGFKACHSEAMAEAHRMTEAQGIKPKIERTTYQVEEGLLWNTKVPGTEQVVYDDNPEWKPAYDQNLALIFQQRCGYLCAQGTSQTAPPTSPTVTTPTSTPSTSSYESIYPWRKFSTNTQALQRDLNKALPDLGYNLIAVDGVLGPATCGAAKVVQQSPGYGYVDVPGSCKGFTAPTRRGSGAPQPAPSPAPSPSPSPSGPSSPAPAPGPALPSPGAGGARSNAGLWFTVAVIAGVGGIIYYGRKTGSFGFSKA